MKNYIHYIPIVALALFLAIPGFSQSERTVKVEASEFVKQNERLSVAFDMILNDVQLNRNNLLMVTPVLRSNATGDSLELAPVAVAGATREKVIRRNKKFGKPSGVPDNAFSTLKRENNSP